MMSFGPDEFLRRTRTSFVNEECSRPSKVILLNGFNMVVGSSKCEQVSCRDQQRRHEAALQACVNGWASRGSCHDDANMPSDDRGAGVSAQVPCTEVKTSTRSTVH